MRYIIHYAICPHDRRPNPIQLAKPSPEGGFQQWTKTDGVSEFVLCTQCNRVVEIQEDAIETREASYGLYPNPEEAPLRVFEIPIECDELDCAAQAIVLVPWTTNTSGEELRQKSKSWILSDLRCPDGHRFPWPPWR